MSYTSIKTDNHIGHYTDGYTDIYTDGYPSSYMDLSAFVEKLMLVF